MEIGTPIIRYDGKYSVVDAVVKLHEGIIPRGIMAIYEECYNYEGDVFFAKRNSENQGIEKRVNAKNPMEMLDYFRVRRGDKIQIGVEGNNAKAREQLLRLYSGVHSKNSWHLNFGVHKEKEILI